MVTANVEVHGLEAERAYITFGALGMVILLNLNSEKEARRTQTQLEQQLEGISLTMEEMQNMSPEELSKIVGEFLKGMEEAQKKNE